MLILILLWGGINSLAQPLDYCDYFTLKVSKSKSGDDINIYFHPVIIGSRKTDFGRFIKAHDVRFNYLLWKYSDKLQEISQLFPDTAVIANKFCNEIIKSDSIQRLFNALTPKTLTTWDLKKNTYTTQELMIVASKFFFCNRINKCDTTINYKICIGINGQNENVSGKNMLILEAFTIEAILYYISKRKNPEFLSQFNNILKEQMISKRKEFKDYDSYLSEVRQICYLEMQKNQDLKKKLLDYFESNRYNLNFEIK